MSRGRSVWRRLAGVGVAAVFTVTIVFGPRGPADLGDGVASAAPRPATSRDATTYTVCIDPGHGGPESGAVHQWANGGRELIEKHVNLWIGLVLNEILTEEGYVVVMTRDTDRAVHPLNNGGGYRGVGLREDLQRRIDICNEADADLFVSIHHNGSEDRSVSGAEVWYNKAREFANRNAAFAQLALDHLVNAVRGQGYYLVNRGVKDDEFFRVRNGQAYNIFVLGPGNGARPHEPTRMPGVLIEGAFVSHNGDAQALANPDMRRVMARAYADAVNAYFERFPK